MVTSSSGWGKGIASRLGRGRRESFRVLEVCPILMVMVITHIYLWI